MPKEQNKNIITKERFDLKGRDYMYRALFENLSEAALVLGKRGTIVYSNKYFASLTGYELQKIIGSSFYSILNQEANKYFEETLLAAKTNRSYCQMQLTTKQGESITVVASVNSFYVEDEVYFSLIVSDISAQKKLEQGLEAQLRLRNTELQNANQKLMQTNKELSEANESLDNFVHAVAHDLRTPVANLKLIEKMFDVAPESEKIKLFQNVKDNIRVLDNTLLGLVQIIESHDKKEINQPDIDIMKIVEEVLKNKTAEIDSSGAIIKTVKKTNEKINHVEAYIRSIARNMIGNALKYKMPGRQLELTITLEKVKNNFVLSFSDNGMGIDLKKHKDKLFKPFSRFSSSTEGMGIGLHLINKMVRRNDGFIKVSSEPEKGTTFSVYLKEYDS